MLIFKKGPEVSGTDHWYFDSGDMTRVSGPAQTGRRIYRDAVSQVMGSTSLDEGSVQSEPPRLTIYAANDSCVNKNKRRINEHLIPFGLPTKSEEKQNRLSLQIALKDTGT